MAADAGNHAFRWSNVPVPEPHVVALAGGLLAQWLKPWRGASDARSIRAAGIALVGVGVLLIEWAVRTVGEQHVSEPTALVSEGPYACSRNPMYVAWTILYLGVALLLNTVWLFLWLPAVLASTHWVVLQEERSLQRTFGDDYREYRRTVRRYL